MIVVGVVAVKKVPGYINGLVNDYFARKMPNAHFEMQDVSVSAFSPGKFTAREIKYISSTKGIAELEVEVGTVTVDLEILPLLKGEVKISSLRIESPRVIFRNSEALPAREKASGTKKGELNFDARSAEIVGGEFTYIRMAQGTVATLHFHDISGSVEPLGKTYGNEVRVTARGRIEKSGEVKLKVATPLFTSLKVDVDVEVTDQNLADLTPFFKENAGVELHGLMLEGKGKAVVEGDTVTASVFARYKDFELKLHGNHARSDAAAFFSNLGIAIATHEKNLDQALRDQKRGVTLKRNSAEPVVAFILRALKEAALRVSMAKES